MTIEQLQSPDPNKLYIPYRESYGIKPEEVNALTTRSAFYAAELWRLFFGRVKIVIPEYWNIDYFRWVLFGIGSIAITDVDGLPYPAAYSVMERNRWKYPIRIQSADEVDFGERVIGENCEILYLSNASGIENFYSDIANTVEVYAQRMANCDGAIDINLLNSRAAYIVEVDSASEAADFRNIFTRIYSGKPAVFWRKHSHRAAMGKDEPTPITTLPVKNNYVANDIQEEKEAIRNEFLQTIGINCTPSQKKERMLVDEVNSNNEEIDTAVGLWIDNLDRQIKKVKKLYPDLILDINFEVKGVKHNDEADRAMRGVGDSQPVNGQYRSN